MGFGLRSRGVEARSQTETAANVIEAALNANAAAYFGGSGAIEYAAGLVSRPLSVGEVAGTDLLTPVVLAEIGRACMVRGESLHALTIEDGFRLAPASSWTVQAGNDAPSTWRYRAYLAGPAQQRVMDLGVESVLHVIRDPDARQPWRGIPAATRAAAAVATYNTVERQVEQETGIPARLMLPLGQQISAGETKRIKKGIIEGVRKILLAPWNPERGTWEATRLGPDVPTAHVTLLRDAYGRVLAALGIPTVFSDPDPPGASLREGRRLLQEDTLAPLAGLVSFAASLLLNESISITLPLREDLEFARARALKVRADALTALIAAKIPVAEARRLTGLL